MSAEEPSPQEKAALEFAFRWRAWQNGLWHIVNDVGYRSVEMEREVAEQEARMWPAPPDRPYRAEPCPRPTLEIPS